MPRNSAGRVYCGYSAARRWDSSSADASLPIIAGHQPAHRLEHHHGRDLAARARSRRWTARRRRGGAHPLVDALVATAPAARSRRATPARAMAWSKQRPPGRAGTGAGGATASTAPKGLGHEHHAGAAAVGRVVDRAVRVGGGRAQVVDPHVEQALASGLAQQAAAGEVPDHVGKMVKTSMHPTTYRSRRPSGGSTTRVPSSRRSVTKRTGISAPTVEHEQVRRRVLLDRLHHADGRALGVHDRRPMSSWTKGVGVVERLGPQQLAVETRRRPHGCARPRTARSSGAGGARRHRPGHPGRCGAPCPGRGARCGRC